MQTNNSPTAANIFERLSRDEPEAFDDFIEQFGRFVAFAVRKFTRPGSDDFDDAMQDSLLAVWQAAPHFDRSRGAETTFIGTIIRRLMISRWQKASSKGPRISLEAQHVEPFETSVHPEVDHRLMLALDRLDPSQRTLVELAVIRGKTHAQIARATGMSPKEVKYSIRRALNRLRNDLTERRAAA
jgi:RNA polymerase sigma-70 factor (ECF subfamily)